MADIRNVIDSLRYAKTNADGNIWIANSERDAMVRILTKTAELLKEQQTEIEDLRTAMQSMIEGLCVIAGNKQQPKTGHWIFNGDEYYEAWGHDCSECGKHMTTAKGMYANYCWNCGAKMENATE